MSLIVSSWNIDNKGETFPVTLVHGTKTALSQLKTNLLNYVFFIKVFDNNKRCRTIRDIVTNSGYSPRGVFELLLNTAQFELKLKDVSLTKNTFNIQTSCTVPNLMILITKCLVNNIKTLCLPVSVFFSCIY